MTALGKRFLALFLSLTLTVALLELALRLVPPAARYRDTAVDTLFTEYRLPEAWGAKREFPEIVRVLVLGDSFTWGDGVHEEDAYPFRMQFRMNLRDGSKRYRVLNAGRNGLNTAQQRELIDTLGLLAAKPDLVLVGFSLNDPEPSVRAEAEAMKDSMIRRKPVGRAELELYHRSLLFRLVFDRIENTRQRRARNDYVAALFDPESAHWRECVRALTSIRDLLAERGIPLLVAIWPAFDAPFDDGYPYQRHHDQVMATLAELGIPGVDLRPLYEGVEVRRLAVTPFTDAHPNELAHRIAADFLAEHVRRCLTVEVEEGARRRSWSCPEEAEVD